MITEKMSVEEREAEIGSLETLRWMAISAHKYIQVLSDVALGKDEAIEKHAELLKHIFALRLYDDKLQQSIE